MEKIQEWWEEPAPQQEESWEDVNTKTLKKKPIQGGGAFRGGGRGQGPGRGRGNFRGGGGGRGGGGREQRGGRTGERGRGGPPQKRDQSQKEEKPEDNRGAKSEEPTVLSEAGLPVPFSSAPVLKGAWGARAAASAVTMPPPPAAPASSASTEPPEKAPQPKPEDIAKPLEANPLEVGIASQNDPTPSGLPDSKPIRPAPPPSGGNVWATKGSAHLIQAAMPPAPYSPPAPAPAAPAVPVAPAPVEVAPAPFLEPTLESGLPSSVTGGIVWGKQPEPVSAPIEMPLSAPAVVKPMSNPIPPAPVPVSPEPQAAPPPPSPVVPANVLNMGHWETGDGDDSQNLDFGFGSFGADNDADPNKASPSAEASAAAAAAVSPARPPPGLSLGGMPPMPESAIMVHELENKMENAALNSAPKEAEAKPMTASLPPQPTQQQAAMPAPVLPSAGVTQHNYNQYGMPGMYNYNAAAGGGFVGMTPAGPMLAGGVVPQQPGKPQGGGMPGMTTNAPHTLPQQGLYGTQPPPVPSSGNAPGLDVANTETATGVPPGMPGAIPYANPALHYGQHQYYMGQPQGGIGYNYGYGQFGGVAQGGFGYQQVMGQSQGYGAPHYDDHAQQANTHHAGGSGGYQKNTGGGYRGRNNHHNNNQYQNQYQPQQHAGYGGQPYGMGYHGDHFNQRGGYPGGMGDPYGMQQQQGMHSAGGFQDDDHQKGKKGGRGNNSSLQQQFQQQGPPQQQLGGQQPFGLQGQGQAGTESTPSTGGAGGGGWSNQAGGWSGGAPSWQGS
jgi:hypothetical protein